MAGNSALEATVSEGEWAIGVAGPFSVGEACVSGAVAIGMVMSNAAFTQQQAQEIELAATSTVLAKMVIAATKSG